MKQTNLLHPLPPEGVERFMRAVRTALKNSSLPSLELGRKKASLRDGGRLIARAEYLPGGVLNLQAEGEILRLEGVPAEQYARLERRVRLVFARRMKREVFA